MTDETTEKIAAALLKIADSLEAIANAMDREENRKIWEVKDD